ncbi:hypothetical protein [Mesorhizobium sp.]|uniref:hypothetical protein n=1 Tax=Mesorhizobium sp. TaxID=1871066 RepID=UPI0012011F9E|nr:hypothetical protein [Mesorhizobium sp.]TIM37765.1 MAG: hypothetical protein E5Y56_32480 [Mesorhizobium sp.]
MPTDTDNNLRQYCARLEGMAAGQDVFLYVTGLQQYSFELWRKICGILSDLFKLTGFPLDYVDLELFLGKYEVTPGGIHRDRATTFHSVVFGQKSMLIWSQPELFPLEWSKEDCTIPAFQKLDYRQYLDIATVVEAGPGSTIYWAPDHWHCGSSKTFSVVLNVAINFGGRPLEFLFDGLSSSLNGPELERIALDECVGTGTLPSQLRAAAETLTRLPFESWVFESAEDHWLKRLTGCGFRQRPALRPPVVPINATVISRADSFPIFYYKRSSGYSVATAGHVWREVSDSFDVVKCVDMINSGATHELASYFAFCSPNPTSRLELTRFFQQLNAIGAVEFG